MPQQVQTTSASIDVFKNSKELESLSNAIGSASAPPRGVMFVQVDRGNVSDITPITPGNQAVRIDLSLTAANNVLLADLAAAGVSIAFILSGQTVSAGTARFRYSTNVVAGTLALLNTWSEGSYSNSVRRVEFAASQLIALGASRVGELLLDLEYTASGTGDLDLAIAVSLEGIQASEATQLATQTPANVNTSGNVGVSSKAAREDHVHGHGSLSGGTMHAEATQSTSGFMSATDKEKLDSLLVETSATETSIAAGSGNLSLAEAPSGTVDVSNINKIIAKTIETVGSVQIEANRIRIDNNPIAGGAAPSGKTYLTVDQNGHVKISSNGVAHSGLRAVDLSDGVIADAKVDPAAGIVESKLALNFATHSNANDPSTTEKAALVGTSGVPSGANKYVTDSDTRNSDARTPSGAAGGDLTGTYPNPRIASDVIVDANVNASAGIVESKLALNFATHSNANDPTASQKAALVGTGTPSGVNPYVVKSSLDARSPMVYSVYVG